VDAVLEAVRFEEPAEGQRLSTFLSRRLDAPAAEEAAGFFARVLRRLANLRSRRAYLKLRIAIDVKGEAKRA
jgi:hypothetical protein